MNFPPNFPRFAPPSGGSKAGEPETSGLRPLTVHDLQCAKEVRILILDDDPATCQVIEATLSSQDFVIKTVSNPAEAEAALRPQDGRQYDLIILDYVLPGLDSDQVFGWVYDYQPDASIIVVTGYPSMDSAVQCLRNRTYDYMTKPFQVSQMRAIVMRCLESKGLLRMSEEALRESLGAAIRERRKAMGLTLAQMAQRTEVSLGYLSQIELGKNSASIETLYRVCLALGIKMADLFNTIQRM